MPRRETGDESGGAAAQRRNDAAGPLPEDDGDRVWMVERDLRSRGIADERVLRAFLEVDRSLFVPRDLRVLAYADHPVPIGHGQTISQPFIVAYMIEQLEVRSEHSALEVGAGSGYVLAILSRLCSRVVGTERVRELARTARERLRRAGVHDAVVRYTPATLGAPGLAPFDRILVSAASNHIPRELIDQLADGGIMVIPAREHDLDHHLWKIRKNAGKIERERLLPVRFVPLK